MYVLEERRGVVRESGADCEQWRGKRHLTNRSVIKGVPEATGHGGWMVGICKESTL